MIQSGHAAKDYANYEYVDRDYRLSPVKPTLDAESRYEDHPVNWQPEKNGWFDEIDIRQSAYWATFAGAFGHTYGCHPIWQMLAWKEAGGLRAAQLDGCPRSARRITTAVPPGSDQGVSNRSSCGYRISPSSSTIRNAAPDHAQATRGDGYAFVYIPSGRPMKIRLGNTTGKALKAWWGVRLRTGAAKAISAFPNAGERAFTPPGSPSRGNDWVLVLDDAALNFSLPGQGTSTDNRIR